MLLKRKLDTKNIRDQSAKDNKVFIFLYLQKVVLYVALQGIFPTQRLNPDLPSCRQILYHLSQQGSN